MRHDMTEKKKDYYGISQVDLDASMEVIDFRIHFLMYCTGEGKAICKLNTLELFTNVSGIDKITAICY
jgi:hypothetical protein